jgi:uncharacterized membrane protein
MNLQEITRTRNDGRLFGCLSLFCWAVCLAALAFALSQPWIFWVALAALTALGGVVFTTLAARQAFLSLDRIAFLTLAISILFAIAACWMALFVWSMDHYPS